MFEQLVTIAPLSYIEGVGDYVSNGVICYLFFCFSLFKIV